MGQITDFITGEILKKTHDELYRQKLAQILVNEKDYQKKEITPRFELTVTADDKKAIIPVDFIITMMDRMIMIIKYGPGSLTTRHRPALAISRLATTSQVPIVVVTNGRDADILDGTSGQIVKKGLKNIPSKADLKEIISNSSFQSIPKDRAEMESRILYAFEVDGSCPCDDTICKL